MELDRNFFSSINYQTLLGIPEQAADQLAGENQVFRDFCVDKFDRRLSFLIEHFSDQNTAGIPAAEHLGWEKVSQSIALAQQQQGSVILALFHFGLHRSILVDLACNGIPVVAPIAGKAYWDFYQKKHVAPAEFADCFNLVEVDSVSVGKQLVRQMRKGNLITIYVDGNMGPDGAHVTEGGVTVQFCGREIHVKEGISRLAATFKLPVLPLFSLKQAGAEDIYHIAAGELLPATPDLMQKLYHQLETHVRQRPQNWEYITCCHRWMVSVEGTRTQAAMTYEQGSGLQLHPKNVRLVQQGEDVFLFNLNKQTAFKLPDWSAELSCLLRDGCTKRDIHQWLEQGDKRYLKIKLINELMSKELVTSSL